ncbi:MAG: aldose epimerase [Lagierella massiliensis]|nr:aldose epimerase [Lagierella massiliensis]
MKIVLQNNKINVKINSLGAYVEKFSFDSKPIFYPKSQITIQGKVKTRGGMHPCCPNFSVDEISDLPSHGFIRDLEFEVLYLSNEFVKLKSIGIGNYKNVDFFIEYSINENSLNAQLRVKNKSDHAVPLAPAFHPYFYLENFKVDIANFEIKKDKLPQTQFLETNSVQFSCNGKNLSIRGENVNVFAIWSDSIDKYLCIEPTYNGVAFVKNSKNIYYLNPDKEFFQKITIELL